MKITSRGVGLLPDCSVSSAIISNVSDSIIGMAGLAVTVIADAVVCGIGVIVLSAPGPT